MDSDKPRVAVVGAGIAGLAAARRLLDEGLGVTLVEARPRVGGRIDTRHDFAASPIDLGAEFVHGRHPGLVGLVAEAGLRLVERRFDPVILEAGRVVATGSTWEKIFAELGNPDASDVPIASRIADLLRSGAWTDADARRMQRYVEGYMAGEVDRISARALLDETRAAEAIGDDGNASIREGYDALVRHVTARCEAGGARFLLGAAVRRIDWRRGSAVVHVATSDGEALAPIPVERVIVTVPLGILQLPEHAQGAIVFEPAVPGIVKAAQRLAMGNVVKIYLRLRGPLAEIPGLDVDLARRLENVRFLQTPTGEVPTWWRVGEDAAPILVGWAGGPTADRLSRLGATSIVRAGIESLARALGVDAARVSSWIDAAVFADWSADPWARGAYSWIPAGALDAPGLLATPVDGTLFFAGEATDTAGYRGTVHGALETGLRAAGQVLGSMTQERGKPGG